MYDENSIKTFNNFYIWQNIVANASLCIKVAMVIFYDKTLWTPSMVKILTYDRGKLKILNMKTFKQVLLYVENSWQ